MIPKPLDQITAQDVTDLVTNKVPEDKTLEYKEALPGPKDSERRECSADLTALANTQGGDLLYGITEERDLTTGQPTGRPQEARGLTTTNPEQDILRLTTLIRDTTDPRLTNLQATAILGFPDGPIILVRVPDSWNKPHMVTTNKKFYARTSSGKYDMDTNQLRNAFLQAEEGPKRIKAFRQERINDITSGNTPITVPDWPKLILHLIPNQALTPGYQIDVRGLRERLIDLQPLQAVGGLAGYHNLDGFLAYSIGGDGTHYEYTQVFRNGIMELVDTTYLTTPRGSPRIPAVPIERALITVIPKRWSFLQSLGVQSPLTIMLTLVGVKGYPVSVPTPLPIAIANRPLDRDILALPEVLIDEPVPDIPTVLRPIFDILWQAGGWDHCHSYQADGTWRPQP